MTRQNVARALSVAIGWFTACAVPNPWPGQSNPLAVLVGLLVAIALWWMSDRVCDLA